MSKPSTNSRSSSLPLRSKRNQPQIIIHPTEIDKRKRREMGDLTSPRPPSRRGQRAPPSAEAGAASNPAPGARGPKCNPRGARREPTEWEAAARLPSRPSRPPTRRRLRLASASEVSNLGEAEAEAAIEVEWNGCFQLQPSCRLLDVLWVGGDGESGWTAGDGHREERTHRGRP